MPTRPVAHRPTLLIGYGRHGLDLLRHFLRGTATRGMLGFEDDPAAGSSRRRLRDLGLLWVRDPFEPPGAEVSEPGAGSQAELLLDLDEQVQRVEATQAEAIFRERLRENAQTLLDAARRASWRDTLPLGLDVIVAAHPASREDLGRLGQLFSAGCDELQRYATQLEPAVATANALNFIAILDFDNYWEDSEPGRELRESLEQTVTRWRQRSREGKATFGRIYLVDGFTAGGIRSPAVRLDETTLFLEFLLFEGQRAGPLQSLFQPQTPGESPLATFGIRLHERSAGLLSRLAAAYFGLGWLDYLAGNDPPPHATVLELSHQLARFGALELPAAFTDFDAAEAGVALGTEDLEPADPDWPQRLQAAAEAAAGAWERETDQRVRRGLSELRRQAPWDDLPGRLRATVTAALHADRHPVPLGLVLDTITAAAEPPRPGASATSPHGPDTRTDVDPWAELSDLHAAARRFRDGQVDARHLQAFLFWFSLLLALAITPVLADVLLAIPRQDPAMTPFPLPAAHRLGHWLAGHGAVLALILAGVIFAGTATVVGRGTSRRNQQAHGYWTDRERGRLSDRRLALMAPDGRWGRWLREVTQRHGRRAGAALRAEVQRELQRILVLLRRRQRELRWLRGQLHEFLSLQGLNPTGAVTDWNRLDQVTTGIRHAVESASDLERVLESNPPLLERFASTQADLQPFRNWDRPYSEAFLYPLRFIDDLSERYHDPYEQTHGQPRNDPIRATREAELLEFLRDYGDFPPALAWRARESVPLVRLHCLVPENLASLPAIRQELLNLGVAEGGIIPGSNPERAYLLRTQLGVAPTCLLT